MFSADERLETGKCTKWSGNVRRSFPKGKGGLPLEVAYNLRTDFSENCCFLRLQPKFPDHFPPYESAIRVRFPVMVLSRGLLSFQYELLGPLVMLLVDCSVVSFQYCLLPVNLDSGFLLRFDLIFRLGNTMHIYYISLKTT